MVSKELELNAIKNFEKNSSNLVQPHYTLDNRHPIKIDGKYACIGSYPRSGRNYLDNLLCSVNPELHFSFEHSFDMITKHNYLPCVLLLRHPLYACISYMEYAYKNGHLKLPYEKLYHKDNKDTFYERLTYMVIEWFWLYDKLITLEWKCILRYETLVFKPVDTIKKILDICNISYTNINEKEILSNMNIQALNKKKQKKYKPRSLWNCPFYNRKDMADIWDYIDTNLKLRGLCLGWI